MLTVLVADDEPKIRRLLRLTLEQTHRVVEAADGEEALRVLFLERPDILLLDVAMPKLDGLAVCRAARDTSAFDRLGIIVISANASANEALLAGADLHMPKPFRPHELLAAIEDVVAQRQAAAPDGRTPVVARLLDAG